jgi:hypothetical protein
MGLQDFAVARNKVEVGKNVVRPNGLGSWRQGCNRKLLLLLLIHILLWL